MSVEGDPGYLLIQDIITQMCCSPEWTDGKPKVRYFVGVSLLGCDGMSVFFLSMVYIQVVCTGVCVVHTPCIQGVYTPHTHVYTPPNRLYMEGETRTC